MHPSLSLDLMNTAENKVFRRSFRRHERMPSDLCCLWQIQSGVVRTLTWTDEGKVVPLGFWGTGSLIGSSIVQVFPYEIECLTAVEAERIKPNKPLPSLILLEHISQASQLMQILHCSRIDCRLEQFIGWFAAQFGQVQPDGVHLQVKLTHQELSEAVGTTRVTVTRVIRQLEDAGKISWSRHQQIVSQQLLEQIAIQRSYV